MEFKEIRHIWNDSFAKEEMLNREQIEEMLLIKKRSNTALGKMKRSFRIELIGGAIEYVFIVGALFYFLNVGSAFIFTLLVSVLMGIPYYLYFRSYQSIGNTNYTEDNLNRALTRTTDDLKRFIRYGTRNIYRYVQIPLALITGMVMGIFIATTSTSKDFIETIMSMETLSILKMVAVLVIGSGILIPLSIFSYKKRFERHYNELVSCLKEIKDHETN